MRRQRRQQSEGMAAAGSSCVRPSISLCCDHMKLPVFMSRDCSRRGRLTPQLLRQHIPEPHLSAAVDATARYRFETDVNMKLTNCVLNVNYDKGADYDIGVKPSMAHLMLYVRPPGCLPEHTIHLIGAVRAVKHVKVSYQQPSLACCSSGDCAPRLLRANRDNETRKHPTHIRTGAPAP